MATFGSNFNFGLDWLKQGVQNSPNDAGNTVGQFPELDLLNQNNASGAWGDMDFTGKLGAVGTGISAFSSLANIYAGFKAMKLAKSQFKFQKDAWNKNYNAQVKDYENTLRDRWTARDASAQLNNRQFSSMEDWMSPRQIAPTTG